ncbi:MAG: hypothetical protein HZA01_04230 [Nitrospinae bacterium]|nr:hypothetical protein [Nitrospinota bacterium]
MTNSKLQINYKLQLPNVYMPHAITFFTEKQAELQAQALAGVNVGGAGGTRQAALEYQTFGPYHALRRPLFTTQGATPFTGNLLHRGLQIRYKRKLQYASWRHEFFDEGLEFLNEGFQE